MQQGPHCLHPATTPGVSPGGSLPYLSPPRRLFSFRNWFKIRWEYPKMKIPPKWLWIVNIINHNRFNKFAQISHPKATTRLVARDSSTYTIILGRHFKIANWNPQWQPISFEDIVGIPFTILGFLLGSTEHCSIPRTIRQASPGHGAKLTSRSLGRAKSV